MVVWGSRAEVTRAKGMVGWEFGDGAGWLSFIRLWAVGPKLVAGKVFFFSKRFNERATGGRHLELWSCCESSVAALESRVVELVVVCGEWGVGLF